MYSVRSILCALKCLCSDSKKLISHQVTCTLEVPISVAVVQLLLDSVALLANKALTDGN